MKTGSSVPGFDPNDLRALAFRRVAGARLSQGNTSEQGPEHFLKTPTGQLLVLREQEQFLWELLDGSSSFEEIERRFRSRFGMGLAAPDFAAFLTELIEAGAVERIPQSEHQAMLAALATANVHKIAFAAAGGSAPVEADGGGTIEGEFAGRDASPERQGSGAAASAAGAPPGGTAGPSKPKQIWHFSIGNPERAFDVAAAVFWPMRRVCWLLVPLLMVAFLITIKHWDQYMPDLSKLLGRIPQWLTLIATEHVISWFARLAEAVVIHGFGGKVKELRFNLVLGIFPRLWIDESALRSMPRREKAWVNATPLLFRLALFAFAILAWILFRQTHPTGSQVALMVATFALAGFMVSACPLLPLYGYRVLSILLDQEKLNSRALAFVKLRIRGRPAPDAMTPAERWGLTFMAVGTVLVCSIYFGHILYGLEATAIEALHGFGIWVGIGLVVMAIIYAYTLYRHAGKLRAMHRASRAGRRGSGMGGRGMGGSGMGGSGMRGRGMGGPGMGGRGMGGPGMGGPGMGGPGMGGPGMGGPGMGGRGMGRPGMGGSGMGGPGMGSPGRGGRGMGRPGMRSD